MFPLSTAYVATFYWKPILPEMKYPFNMTIEYYMLILSLENMRPKTVACLSASLIIFDIMLNLEATLNHTNVKYSCTEPT